MDFFSIPSRQKKVLLGGRSCFPKMLGNISGYFGSLRRYRTPSPDCSGCISPKLKASPKKSFLEKALGMMLGEEACYIRCEEPIDYNPEKSYYSKCFASESRLGNPNCKEKFYHKCRNRHAATKIQPIIGDRYTAN